MSNRERFAQVAQRKWANERVAKIFWLKNIKSYFFSTFCIGFVKKMSDLLIPSFLVSNVSKSLRLLTKNEQCERIAQVAHQKWAMWANRSGRSPKMSNHERFAQVAQRKWAIVSKSLRWLTKNERISKSLVFWSESLICSFSGKKRAICLENRWANSQPWVQHMFLNMKCTVYTVHWTLVAVDFFRSRIGIVRLVQIEFLRLI